MESPESIAEHGAVDLSDDPPSGRRARLREGRRALEAKRDQEGRWDGGLSAFMRRVLSGDHGHLLYSKRKYSVEPGESRCQWSFSIVAGVKRPVARGHVWRVRER